jgi:hypothetical protein
MSSPPVLGVVSLSLVESVVAKMEIVRTGLLRGLMLAALLAVGPVAADAGPLTPSTIKTGDVVKITGLDGGTFGAGPIKIDGPDLNTATDFLTFCLEINEFITFNTPFYVKIADYATNGGAGGSVNGKDPLDQRTAFLYSNFLKGTLGSAYTGDVNSKDGLQLAIWRIEQEVKRVVDPKTGAVTYRRSDNNAVVGNAAKFEKADALYNMALSANGFYGVKVMQLWGNKDYTGNKQDLLIFVPEGASTLGVLLLGMSVIAAARSRFKA